MEIFKIYNQGQKGKKKTCDYKLSHHEWIEMSVPNTLSLQKLRCYVRLFGYWLIFSNWHWPFHRFHAFRKTVYLMLEPIFVRDQPASNGWCGQYQDNLHFARTFPGPQFSQGQHENPGQFFNATSYAPHEIPRNMPDKVWNLFVVGSVARRKGNLGFMILACPGRKFNLQVGHLESRLLSAEYYTGVRVVDLFRVLHRYESSRPAQSVISVWE